MSKQITWKNILRIIIKYLRPYKKAVGVLFGMVILENGLRLTTPIIFGKTIDLATKTNVFNRQILQLLALWIGLNLLTSWIQRIKTRKIAIVSYKTSQDLIVSSVSHLMRLPMAYHKDKKIGEVVQRITRASNYLNRIVDDGIFEVVPNFISAFLSFAIIMWIEWRLGLFYAVFLLVYVFISIFKTQPIITYQKKLNRAFEKIYGNIYDRTPNIFTVKSNTTEEIEDERNIKAFEDGERFNLKHTLLWTDLMLWQQTLSGISFVAIFGLGGYFLTNHTITIGQFVMLVTYVNMSSFLVNAIGWYYKNLQESFATIEKSETIFEQQTELYENPAGEKLENCKGNVEFENVSFAYEKEAVLKKINFSVKAGEMLAIVGRSGEGKTTLINLISRYIEPQEGKIKLDGTDIAQIKLSDLREQIAVVPQEMYLFNDTIMNNIRYSKIKATDEEVYEAAKLAECHEFIEKFPKKYAQLVGERGIKLSSGQKQRVAIARAILRNPRILILDEATSALDSESEKYVQMALEGVMRGRTTFVIAHRLSTVRKANKIIVLENGEIAEAGDHEELMQKGGIYQKLSELQSVNV